MISEYTRQVLKHRLSQLENQLETLDIRIGDQKRSLSENQDYRLQIFKDMADIRRDLEV